MSRTVTDWGSLCLAELDGHEEPGTVGISPGDRQGSG
jgi:hypothetical protein